MAVCMTPDTGVVDREGADSNGNVLVVLIRVTWVQEQGKDELQILLVPEEAIFLRQIDKIVNFWAGQKVFKLS